MRPETCDSGVDLSTTGTSSDGEVEVGAASEAECLDGAGVVNKFLTLPTKLDIKQIDWDELDELLQVYHFLMSDPCNMCTLMKVLDRKLSE